MRPPKDGPGSRIACLLAAAALAGVSALAPAGAHGRPALSAAYAQAPASQGLSADPDPVPAGRDPFLAPAPAPNGSPAADTAPLEAVKLSTQGRFTASAPRVGDSLDYIVQVEWEDTQVPVVVLAPDSLDFPGFKVLGQATVHKKLAAGASVRNHTEFVYHLQARTQGPGKASSMKVRYLTGLSRQEEAVYLPTALADIGPAPIRLWDRLWFKLLLWAAILAGAGALALAAFRLASRRKSRPAAARPDFKPEAAALKSRIRSAQNTPDAAKAILLEMEGLAMRFLKDALGPEQTALRFDPLLDAYLARAAAGPERSVDGGGSAADWGRLREWFRHARFAGGYLEPHELQDAFRTFRKCLKITGEDEHE